TVRSAADRVRTLVRLERELAQLELKRKTGSLAVAIGLGAAAALLAVFAVGFLLAAIAAALALVMPRWAALPLTTLRLLVGIAILGVVSPAASRKGTPPLPEQAIAEAKLTAARLRGDVGAA